MPKFNDREGGTAAQNEPAQTSTNQNKPPKQPASPPPVTPILFNYLIIGII